MNFIKDCCGQSFFRYVDKVKNNDYNKSFGFLMKINYGRTI